jgi:hypothetical protein
MRRAFVAPLLVILALGLTAGPSRAQVGPPLPDHVEEDWVLVVASPDVVEVGPQITTSMSPVSDGSTPFVAFDLNYREYPDFYPGGMQVQVWSGEDLLSTSSQGSAQMQTDDETVSWTQVMTLSNGLVNYDVSNGQSTTWGSFGQGSHLSTSFSASLASLIGYSPDVSVANSGVTWQSNRVTSMTLVQVRYYANGALIATDSTPRPVNLGKN